MSFSDLESKLISFFTRLISLNDSLIKEKKKKPLNDSTDSDSDCYLDSESISCIFQIISLVRSTDLDSEPKPKSKTEPKWQLMSLTNQIVSLVKSMDLDSQPKPLKSLISLISQKISRKDFTNSDSKIISLVTEAWSLDPEPVLISLINQVFSLVLSMDSKWKNLISLCPQVQVSFREGEFYVCEGFDNGKWSCFPLNWVRYEAPEEKAIYFMCQRCYGQNHQEYDKAPTEIKHMFHPKHSLQLVFCNSTEGETRKCYCCEQYLFQIFYYCSKCDFAMNIPCVKVPPALSIQDLKWHDHALALFPTHASLTCNICALDDSSSPLYMCSPCGFVVHRRCMLLPRVIWISRHHHRLSFTTSFGNGDWSCGVCRRPINNNYGGYSCIKANCSFAAHSRCATQSNVWDGKELEGEPEYNHIEEVEKQPVLSIDRPEWHEHTLSLFPRHVSLTCNICATDDSSSLLYVCPPCNFVVHLECLELPHAVSEE